MMLVTLSLEYCRTRFQTLITSPQVVSTNRHPLASSIARVETSVPNAGMITISSFFNSSMSASFSFPERNLIPIARI